MIVLEFTPDELAKLINYMTTTEPELWPVAQWSTQFPVITEKLATEFLNNISSTPREDRLILGSFYLVICQMKSVWLSISDLESTHPELSDRVLTDIRGSAIFDPRLSNIRTLPKALAVDQDSAQKYRDEPDSFNNIYPPAIKKLNRLVSRAFLKEVE